MEPTRPLTELTRADEPRFGGKSASLGELLAGGIPVPPGFALSVDAFGAFMSAAGVNGTDPDAAREAMRRARVPDAVAADVRRGYGELGDGVPVAVRSSAVGEDSEAATFAGQQETYLWVRGGDAVLDAVRDCWASLYSAPAVSYRAHLGAGAPEPAMGVTVQLMVDAAVSGVMFTCNPLSGDPSMVAINASWGLGLAVVGGEVTPDDFLVSKVTGEVVREHVHDKAVEYVPDPGGHGAVRVPVDGERRHRRCLGEEAIAELLDVAKRVERHFGSHQDVEWAIARDDGQLHVLQSRPVTAVRKPEAPATQDAMGLVMRTFGAGSPGEP
jgi:pyruvate,water dikinase